MTADRPASDRPASDRPANGRADVLSSYREAGRASAEAVGHAPGEHPQATSAAFFDVDNTIMRGASIFHLAVGLARRNFFSGREIWGFGAKQLKFVLSGSEDLEDMASATEAALSFVEGRRVDDLVRLGDEIFDEILIDKLIPGTLALAQGHLDAGQEVWLVTATPIEVATMIARRLGLTGALGTVSEIEDGVYTGRLVGKPLHGLAKAEAIRALAEREGLDLATSAAYSDSSNDIPMLSAVGRPAAVNPDSTLRSHARANNWPVYDFRRREQMKEYAKPALITSGGILAGLAVGYLAGRARKP
jgi:HAD superfamily hydrolase (TIGR01490 family)